MKLTVFLVDDDAASLTTATRSLRASGFAVQPCSSARGFLAQRDGGTPGCVIADFQMPETNGLDLQAGRARTPNALPVIFLTGRCDISATVRAMRDGVPAEERLIRSIPKPHGDARRYCRPRRPQSKMTQPNWQGNSRTRLPASLERFKKSRSRFRRNRAWSRGALAPRLKLWARAPRLLVGSAARLRDSLKCPSVPVPSNWCFGIGPADAMRFTGAVFFPK